ncbi:alpha/beta fold hydrolase [Kribbella shirazensis]|uniref:Proline iminopeptidase n=1 Tax=Kribbella shirazensis TaxID=1105143 RepID=A0A7X6A4I7_9ACTN|nr:alpha/beta fold hydrolase [Kribbella shirazensis]NIK60993.1 proline iminopeptidase [Kribbella shirazensis]
MLTDGVRAVVVGGVEHWVRIAGAGNGGVPLVLLHGGPGESSYGVERSVGDELAKVAPVVFYDQRGCGRTARPSDASTYTMERLVADLEELRTALGLERIVPWGVSFGCLLAAEYAVAHSNHVDRLILHAPPIADPLHPGLWTMRPGAVDPFLTPDERAALRAQLDGVTEPLERTVAALGAIAQSENAARFFYHDPANIPPADENAPEPNLEMAMALVGNERVDLIDDLAALDVPALVLAGLWDRHVGFDMPRDLAARLPRATLEIFHRSAHSIDEEEPMEYVEAIRTFLAR